MDDPTPPKRKGRGVSVALSPKLAAALEYLADGVQTQSEAARLSGMDANGLSRALKKPHVAALLESMKLEALAGLDDLRNRAQVAAIKEGLVLMRTAKSEAIRVKMVELFAGGLASKSPNVVINQALSGPSGYSYPSAPKLGQDKGKPLIAKDITPTPTDSDSGVDDA
jgi:hypothetical protein